MSDGELMRRRLWVWVCPLDNVDVLPRYGALRAVGDANAAPQPRPRAPTAHPNGPHEQTNKIKT